MTFLSWSRSPVLEASLLSRLCTRSVFIPLSLSLCNLPHPSLEEVSLPALWVDWGKKLRYTAVAASLGFIRNLDTGPMVPTTEREMVALFWKQILILSSRHHEHPISNFFRSQGTRMLSFSNICKSGPSKAYAMQLRFQDGGAAGSLRGGSCCRRR